MQNRRSVRPWSRSRIWRRRPRTSEHLDLFLTPARGFFEGARPCWSTLAAVQPTADCEEGGNTMPRQPRILVADDDLASVEFLEAILTQEGYDDVIGTTGPSHIIPLFCQVRAGPAPARPAHAGKRRVRRLGGAVTLDPTGSIPAEHDHHRRCISPGPSSPQGRGGRLRVEALHGHGGLEPRPAPPREERRLSGGHRRVLHPAGSRCAAPQIRSLAPCIVDPFVEGGALPVEAGPPADPASFALHIDAF